MTDWTECKMSWEEFDRRGLNNAGTLVEIEDGEISQYLIGDINNLRGVCDDCTAFPKKSIVTRYKILAEKNWK